MIFVFSYSSDFVLYLFEQVWSSDSDKTHSPPTDILMKGQTWFAGETMKTTLLDQKGEVRHVLIIQAFILHARAFISRAPILTWQITFIFFENYS